MTATQLQPGNDFTNRVMKGVRSRPRKIGLWNLVYIVPLVIVAILLAAPSTRNAMLNTADGKRDLVNQVQQEVDQIQLIVDELDTFDGSALSEVEFASANGQ